MGLEHRGTHRVQAFDPEILTDFLTESGELLEELDADLVELESTPGDPELLNKVFRALHTIKGSASFLALTQIVSIAHAAEDALNTARRGELAIDHAVMDLLLEGVDLLKTQFGELENGTPLSEPRQELLDQLCALGDSEAQASSPTPAPSPSSDPGATTSDPAPTPTAEGDSMSSRPAGRRALDLPKNKLDLLDFMIVDLEESLDDAEIRLERIINGASQSVADDADHITEICGSLTRTAEFFEFEQMRSMIEVLGTGFERLTDLDECMLDQLLPRLAGVHLTLRWQAAGLRARTIVWWSVDTLIGRIMDLVLGNDLDEAALLPDHANAEAALRLDGALNDVTGSMSGQDASQLPDAPEELDDEETAESAAPRAASLSSAGSAGSGRPAAQQARNKIEQTIRVEVSRLESLLNLVGELVLQKNRIGALVRQVSSVDAVPQEAREAFLQSSGDLDRVTSDIQLAVMRTRMQPLDKLFGKYPRLIRDLSSKTGKNIHLVIEGGETEVDRSVIEELGDPLVHLLRNSADHGIEPPQDRQAAGKPEMGTIRMVASQAGDHVLVQIIDDGKGLDRDVLVAKAVEKGMATPEEADNLSDRDVFRFIFGAGFSTVAEVSDLSGRGVGMDVVRTNIEKLKGSVDVESTPGRGTTILIRIPLTVAIMPAMMVGVGEELYAIPLSNIVEIVRPEPAQLGSVDGKRVMRLRDSVLPLVSMADLFETPEERRAESRFAVVIELNEQRAGLLVSRLIGQQEVVIKPLDSGYSGSSPVSGATVRDDGGVSLIVDIARVVNAAKESHNALAAA